jgi:hypothetical protein
MRGSWPNACIDFVTTPGPEVKSASECCDREVSPQLPFAANAGSHSESLEAMTIESPPMRWPFTRPVVRGWRRAVIGALGAPRSGRATLSLSRGQGLGARGRFHRVVQGLMLCTFVPNRNFASCRELRTAVLPDSGPGTERPMVDHPRPGVVRWSVAGWVGRCRTTLPRRSQRKAFGGSRWSTSLGDALDRHHRSVTPGEGRSSGGLVPSSMANHLTGSLNDPLCSRRRRLQLT